MKLPLHIIHVLACGNAWSTGIGNTTEREEENMTFIGWTAAYKRIGLGQLGPRQESLHRMFGR